MDFGLLLLVVPLVWFVLYQAKEATNQTTPKGEPKTGTFIMFVIVSALRFTLIDGGGVSGLIAGVGIDIGSPHSSTVSSDTG
jgi:hypothetical protein